MFVLYKAGFNPFTAFRVVQMRCFFPNEACFLMECLSKLGLLLDNSSPQVRHRGNPLVFADIYEYVHSFLNSILFLDFPFF